MWQTSLRDLISVITELSKHVYVKLALAIILTTTTCIFFITYFHVDL